jgi:hypothetical protein
VLICKSGDSFQRAVISIYFPDLFTILLNPSTQQFPIYRRKVNKGIGIEIAHYLGDGLYLANEIQ